MARAWPAPDAAKTLHVIGDIHYGTLASEPKLPKLANDINTAKVVPRNLHTVQVGDFTEDSTPAQDISAVAWANSLPTLSFGTIVGNHDFIGRSGTAAAGVWGLPGQRNWTRDLGFAKLICISPANDATGDGATIVLDGPDTLAGTALRHLKDQLANATKDCIIVAHAPLQNTVLGQPNSYDSTQDWASLDPDSEIRAILNAQPRAKLFLSGHTHSKLNDPAFIKPDHAVGFTRDIIAINASAIPYTGATVTANDKPHDPICTLYISFFEPIPGFAPNGYIEVRARDHGAGVWTTINGQKVTTVSIPA